MYSAMSSIPSGGPPGGTHTQELWYSLRGIDADLESVLSTDKCSCDACCSRFSTPIFVPFFSYFVPQKIFSANTNFFRRKNPCRKKFSFWFRDCQIRLLKKRKKGSSALDLIITSALSIEEQHTHLLFLPSSRISSTTTNIPLLKTTNLSLWCTLSSHEAFFLWW